VFTLGWRVFRALLGDVVDPARARRAAWAAGGVAVLALVVCTTTHLASGWAGPGVVRPAITIALVTAGVGAVTFGCFPTARIVGPEFRINGRQVRPDQLTSARWSVQPYLGRRQRPVAPADREAVLNDTPLLQRGLVQRLSRLAPVMLGVACAGAAVFTSGEGLVFFVVWPFLYLGLLPEMIVQLGRAERARLGALDAEPAPPQASRPRQRDPRGTKLGLPGD